MRSLPLCVLIACAGSKPLSSPVPAAVTAPVFAADTHLHLTMEAAAKPVFHGVPGREPPTASSRSRLSNQIDPVQLQAAGIRVVLAALWAPPAVRPGRTAFDESMHQIDALETFISATPVFVQVESSAQAAAAAAGGHIGVVVQLEGGEGLRSVDDLDQLYAAGVRALTLVHFVDTQVAGAAAGQLGALLGMPAGAISSHGLTPLGADIVTRMIELGMIIDLAHSSDATANAVLDLADARGVPVLISHTASRALANAERNLSDALALRVAHGGGLIGITLNDLQLSTPAGSPGQAETCDDVVAHWAHFASIVPQKTLVLGSDLNGLISRPIAGGACPDGIRNSGDLPELWAALGAAGITQETRDGMGPAVLAMWQAVESKANAQVQKQVLAKYPPSRLRRTSMFEAP